MQKKAHTFPIKFFELKSKNARKPKKPMKNNTCPEGKLSALK